MLTILVLWDRGQRVRSYGWPPPDAEDVRGLFKDTGTGRRGTRDLVSAEPGRGAMSG